MNTNYHLTGQLNTSLSSRTSFTTTGTNNLNVGHSPITVDPNWYLYADNQRFTGTLTGITTTNTLTNLTINTIMQNKVAVFKVTRNEHNHITDTKFIKELWVQTKNNQSVEFQVARDKDLADYDVNDLVIRTILTVSF